MPATNYVFRVASPVRLLPAGWKAGKDWMAAIRLVSRLKAPLHFADLKEHPLLKSAGFVRGGMRGRYKVSEHWPELHRMLIARNPGLKRELLKFGPDRLW